MPGATRTHAFAQRGVSHHGPATSLASPVHRRAAGSAEVTALLRGGDTASVQRVLGSLQASAGNAAVQRLVATQREAAQVATAQRLEARRGRGRSLDVAVQRRVGGALGADLSSVSVHDDDEADAMARSVDASAFTSGRDIYFTKGAYDPGCDAGLRTIAHEATHVVQQSQGTVDGTPMGGMSVSDPSDRFERQAETTADRVVGGKAAPGHAFGGGPAVQRAGGSCGPCGGKTDTETEDVAPLGSPLQRLVVQRAPLPNEKLGDVEVMFNPTATLAAIEPGSDTPKKQLKNEASTTVSFDQIARSSRGDVQLDVAMQFFKKADSPVPPGQCDVCNILAEALTINLPFPLPSIPVPQSLIDECKKLVKVDISAVEPLLDKIEDAAQEPCNLLSFLNAGDFLITLCKGGNLAVDIFLPHVGEIIKNIQLRVLKGVAAARRALRKCAGQKPAPAPGPTADGKLIGTARAVLSAGFVHNKDGTFSFTGLPPIPQKSGSGANLKVPVDFDRSGAGTVGSISELPLLTGEGANAAVLSKAFKAEIPTTKAAADADFLCAKSFGAFKVASDQFENDDLKIQELRTYYFGMHPKIRQHLETGGGQMLITGRASTTGSQSKNLGFATARAERVKRILAGFAGANAKFNAFSLGELGAQTQGEVGGERRADVESKGSVAEGGELESKCFGHESEPTPTGPTEPVTEGEGIREAQGGEAPQVVAGESGPAQEQPLEDFSPADLAVAEAEAAPLPEDPALTSDLEALKEKEIGAQSGAGSDGAVGGDQESLLESAFA